MGRENEQTFFQRRYTVGQQVHEKMLNINNNRKMQMKTTMKYRLTSIGMAIIKKT